MDKVIEIPGLNPEFTVVEGESGLQFAHHKLCVSMVIA